MEDTHDAMFIFFYPLVDECGRVGELKESVLYLWRNVFFTQDTINLKHITPTQSQLYPLVVEINAAWRLTDRGVHYNSLGKSGVTDAWKVAWLGHEKWRDWGHQTVSFLVLIYALPYGVFGSFSHQTPFRPDLVSVVSKNLHLGVVYRLSRSWQLQ